MFIFYFFICCYFVYCLFFFFFKQMTAYEMRISDWSSDFCSSDLNTFTAIVKTTTTTPCIRTDGPLSQFEISDNTIKNYGTGVDLRTTIGAVDNGFVGIQFFNNITTGFNIAAGCTNISRAFKNLQPV